MRAFAWVYSFINSLSVVVLLALVYWVGLFMEAFQFSPMYSQHHRVLILLWGGPNIFSLITGKGSNHQASSLRRFARWSCVISLVISTVLVMRGINIRTPFVWVAVAQAVYAFYVLQSFRTRTIN